jgi:hypothetical protein
MNRIPVKSSFLAAIGYDEASKTLEVEFKNGKIYQYLEFPAEEFAALRAAESLGAHYNRISRGFPSRRAVELEAPPDAVTLPNLQDRE